MGYRQINIIDVLGEELLVLLEVEEAHIHELAKSLFRGLGKICVFLALKFHAILDFCEICILGLDAGLLNGRSLNNFMNLRLEDLVFDVLLEEQLVSLGEMCIPLILRLDDVGHNTVFEVHLSLLEHLNFTVILFG